MRARARASVGPSGNRRHAPSATPEPRPSRGRHHCARTLPPPPPPMAALPTARAARGWEEGGVARPPPHPPKGARAFDRCRWRAEPRRLPREPPELPVRPDLRRPSRTLRWQGKSAALPPRVRCMGEVGRSTWLDVDQCGRAAPQGADVRQDSTHLARFDRRWPEIRQLLRKVWPSGGVGASKPALQTNLGGHALDGVGFSQLRKQNEDRA